MDLRVFERLDAEVYSVFRDKGVLSLSYVPGVLVCRGREEEYLARVLTRGVSENFLPPMISMPIPTARRTCRASSLPFRRIQR